MTTTAHKPLPWLLHILLRPLSLLWRLVKRILRTNLLAGLLVLMPIVATVYFIHLLISVVDRILLLLPDRFQPDFLLGFHIPGLGLILVLVVVFFTGLIVRNVFGRQIIRMGEAVLTHIPFVSKFYSALKQLVDAIFRTGVRDFKRVVLIEYPRKGVYTLGFVTGVSIGEIQRKTEKRCLNIFVPTTPNPTSGFYLIVPEEDIIPLEMSVEDAFKVLISGGILNPEDKNGQSPAMSTAAADPESKEDVA